MPKDDLELTRWDRLPCEQQETTARELAGSLPPEFRFVGLQAHALGDQNRRVAVFDHRGSAFVLIPGGRAMLGYNRDRPFEPTEQQQESWRGTEEEYGCSLAECLDSDMGPYREAEIEPFLLEATTWEAGLEPLTPDASECDAVRRSKEKTTVLIYSNGQVHRIHDDAFRENWMTQQQVAELVAADGFRLPTSDEWEYACRAGSQTLFRWGDDCPADCYPVDPTPFDLHKRPNAFGLHIGINPYDWEFTGDTGVFRGGDGGGNICGGVGFFAGWLTLASAFLGHWEEDEPVPSGFVRRVYSLK